MLDIAQVFEPGELLCYCIIITSLQLHQKLNTSQYFIMGDMYGKWQDVHVLSPFIFPSRILKNYP